MNLKYTLNFCLFILVAMNLVAQETNNVSPISSNDSIKNQTLTKSSLRLKVDGIAAVVGKYLILDSDIQKLLMEAKQQNISTSEMNSCNMLERIVENKLFIHHAIQDSLDVSEERIVMMSNEQLEGLVAETGGYEKLLEFFGKETEDELRDELFKINFERELADAMKSEIIGDLEVTPEETRQFFESIPEDEIPLFGDEIEIAQIVIEPKISDKQNQEVIDRLNEMRDEILSSGTFEDIVKTFTTKAVFYTEDKASSKTGGKYSLTRKDPFVKEFKDAAFSQKEGEVSKPFKTEFGYHILLVEKIRGQQVDVRHILLYPEVTTQAIKEAEEKAEKLRTQLINKEIEFADAAKSFSDEKETKQNGGQLVNPATGDRRFDLSKIDPELYGRVYGMSEGDISKVIRDEDRSGKKQFKILKVTKRIDEHIADFSDDYPRIKDLALRRKQLNEIKKWKKIKVKDTYIKVTPDYENCDFVKEWVEQTP